MRGGIRGGRVAAVLVALAVLCLPACTSAPAAPASPSITSRVPSPTAHPTAPPRTLVALGDSLSRGTDACSHYGDCPAVSWSTGADPRVDSVASRLQRATGSAVRVVNEARSGAVAADLARQVDAAARARPDVVTLLVGANDVCRPTVAAMTSTAEYAASVGAALHRIAAAAPDAVIAVASVPDVTALLPAAADDPAARFLWSRAGICRSALADPRSGSSDARARRAAVRQRIEQYDATLRRVCGAVPRCVFDGGALTADRPAASQLSSLDEFHPSVAGQRALAALEWRAVGSRVLAATAARAR